MPSPKKKDTPVSKKAAKVKKASRVIKTTKKDKVMTNSTHKNFTTETLPLCTNPNPVPATLNPPAFQSVCNGNADNATVVPDGSAVVVSVPSCISARVARLEQGERNLNERQKFQEKIHRNVLPNG